MYQVMGREFKIIADLNHFSGNADKVVVDNLSCLKQEGYSSIVFEIPATDIQYLYKYKQTGDVEWILRSRTMRNNKHAFDLLQEALDNDFIIYGFDPLDKQLNEIVEKNFPNAQKNEYATIQQDIITEADGYFDNIFNFIELAKKNTLDYAGSVYQSKEDLIDERCSPKANRELANEILSNVKEEKILVVYGGCHLNQHNDLDEILKGEVFYLGDDNPTNLEVEKDWNNLSANIPLCHSIKKENSPRI